LPPFEKCISTHFSFLSFLATINHTQRISVTRAKEEESWYVLSRLLCYVMAFSHNFTKLFSSVKDFGSCSKRKLKFSFKIRLCNLSVEKGGEFSFSSLLNDLVKRRKQISIEFPSCYLKLNNGSEFHERWDKARRFLYFLPSISHDTRNRAVNSRVSLSRKCIFIVYESFYVVNYSVCLMLITILWCRM
jgi:predicted CopG family antitoxin